MITETLNIEQLIVPALYQGTTPSQRKINKRLKEFYSTGKLPLIYINVKDRIVDGYTTYLAAKLIGKTEVDCVRLNDEERSHYIRKKMNRREVLFSDTNICYICGREMVLTSDVTINNAITVDHILPLAKGGTSVDGNLAGACRICNSLKGNELFTEELREQIKAELKVRGYL